MKDTWLTELLIFLEHQVKTNYAKRREPLRPRKVVYAFRGAREPRGNSRWNHSESDFTCPSQGDR